MKGKTLLALTFAASIASASGAVTIGTIINIDFGAANGTPTGAAVIGSAGDAWTTFNTIQGFRENSLVDSAGNSVMIGQFGAGGAGSGGVGGFGYNSDALFEDYSFLNDNGTDADATLNDGTSVAAEQRFTFFGDDIEEGQTWNITFISSGNVASQGLNVSLIQAGGNFIKQQTTGIVYAGALTEGLNFTTFTGVNPTGTGTAAEFDFDLYLENGGGDSANIAGVQLQLVPEPSSALLLGLSTLGLIRRRR